MRAIVLSGGGSKGAYQIGVWKALRRLKIKYDIVTGTSVGALNGALMVTKSYHKAYSLWKNIGFRDVFDQDIKSDYFTPEGKKAIAKKYAKAIFLDHGMSPNNLEKTVEAKLNYKKLKKSKIKFSFITYNLSDLKPKVINIEKESVDKIKHYLIASSSCFPAFQKKKIEGKDYIDGGYYDNFPVNLAIDLGADEIVAIDLKEIGFKRPVKSKKVKIIYISPNNHLGSFLVFDKRLSRKNIKYGYNDTMKVYGKLEGKKYTFKKNHLEKNYIKHSRKFNILIQSFLSKKGLITNLIKRITLKQEYNLRDFQKIIEFLGTIYEIDDTKIYSYRRFNRLLLKAQRKYKLNRINDSRNIINNILNNNTKKTNKSWELAFSKEVLGALYLKNLKNSCIFQRR